MKYPQELVDVITKQWVSPSMVKHCLTSSAYVQLGDSFVDVGSRKPGISSEIYYDDETPAPTINFETFKRHNEHNKPEPLTLERSNYGTVNYLFTAPQYYQDKTDGKLLGYRYENENFDGHRVTAEELETINKVRADIATDYDKRLERYWKRYSDKVSTHGYWANR